MPHGHISKCPVNTGGICSCATESRRYLMLAMLSSMTAITEMIGGLIFGSLALLADAGHTSIDAMENIVLACVASLAKKSNDEQRIRRIGARISAALLLILVLWFLVELFSHFGDDHVTSGYAVWFAIGALAVNLIQYRLHNTAPEEHRNISHLWQNTHLLTDIFGSIAAIVGTTLSAFGVPYADLLAAIAIIGLVVYRFVHSHGGTIDGHHHHGHHH
jgi:cobalt-zinc-cadmium efflux system protein